MRCSTKQRPPDHRGGDKAPGWRMSHPQERASTTGAGFSYQAVSILENGCGRRLGPA